MEAILTDHLVLMRKPVWYSYDINNIFSCCGTSGSLHTKAASSRSPATSPLLSPHSAPAASLACHYSTWRSKWLSEGDGSYKHIFINFHKSNMLHQLLDFFTVPSFSSIYITSSNYSKCCKCSSNVPISRCLFPYFAPLPAPDKPPQTNLLQDFAFRFYRISFYNFTLFQVLKHWINEWHHMGSYGKAIG